MCELLTPQFLWGIAIMVLLLVCLTFLITKSIYDNDDEDRPYADYGFDHVLEIDDDVQLEYGEIDLDEIDLDFDFDLIDLDLSDLDEKHPWN